MSSLSLHLIAAVLYLSASFYQGFCLWRKKPFINSLFIAIGSLGLLAHGFALFPQVFLENGLALSFFNAASLIAIVLAAVMLIGCTRMPLQMLLSPLFALSGITVFVSLIAPTGSVQVVAEHPGILAHILFSILAYGMFTIAVIQSLLLLNQEQQLRKRPISTFIKLFPPLQTMESLLFAFISAGWFFLSLSLITGAIYLQNLFAQHLAHKTLLSCLAWIVFVVLLWGRYRLGWRGQKAIRWTMAGFCLLMLAYFGSKLVREFIFTV